MNTPVIIQPEVLVRHTRERNDEEGRLVNEAIRRFVHNLLDYLADLALSQRIDVGVPVSGP